MKIFRLALSCLFMLAVISFSSCSKNEPKDGPQTVYTAFEYGLEVGDGYSMLYDITCTYTDVCTGKEVTKPMENMGENLYSGRCEGLPKVKDAVIKVEGKLKPNAKQIVDDLIAKQQKVTTGYVCRCTAGIYSDAACTKSIKGLFAVNQFAIKRDVTPEAMKSFIDKNPTNEICVIHCTLK